MYDLLSPDEVVYCIRHCLWMSFGCSEFDHLQHLLFCFAVSFLQKVKTTLSMWQQVLAAA